MTSLVADQVELLLPRTRTPCVVVAEVPAAVGVADLAAVCFDRAAIRHRVSTGIGPFRSPLRVRVLDALRRERPVRLSTLAQQVGSTPRALARSTLRPLASLGAVELGDDAVRATGAWQPVVAHITAVELKLSKWRDAVRQADNFALSADRAWVVLDQARAQAATEAVGYFQAFGVGFAVLDTEGLLRVVSRPAGVKRHRWLRTLMAEQAWANAEAEVSAIASGC
jgi:hypothetical protein